MPLSSREVRSALMNKFQFQPVQGSRHEAVAFFYEGKKVATTRFSHGRDRQIGDDLLRRMATEIMVHNLRFFKEMIGCTKSLDDFIMRLHDNGIV